ncbi:hypothetical protein KKB83_03110, partial [Patescibacteria group bacterium]|nr:hypothetical protein [Patescibacteria group bacterium]
AVVRKVERADDLQVNGISVEPQVAPFRSPWLARGGRDPDPGALANQYGDGIVDVFSYGFLECSVATTPGACSTYSLNDQQGNAVAIDEEFVFTTSTNRLDIQSHINVFPLIPATVLNLRVKSCTSIGGGSAPCIEEGNIEVYANRTVRRATPREYELLFDESTDNTHCDCDTGYTCEGESGWEEDGVADSCNVDGSCREVFMPASQLVVRGRTGRIIKIPAGAILVDGAYFRAFAPPGLYAATLWMSGEGVSYRDYANNMPLGTNYYNTTFVFVDNISESHWNQEDAYFTTAWVHYGQARVDLRLTSSVVWSRVLENLELAWVADRTMLVARDGVATHIETVGVYGDFQYNAGAATGLTNKYGIFAAESYRNANAHGVKIGVADDRYLQSLDTTYVTTTSGPFQTQDFILQTEQPEGFNVYVGVDKGGDVYEGVNGVSVSTLCATCPYTRGSGKELSTHRGNTGYHKPLTQEEPGYFYFSKGWFDPQERNLITFTTSMLSAVCEIPANDSLYSQAGLIDLTSYCTMNVGDTGNIAPDANDAIILADTPSALDLSIIPRIHIPNAYAQEVNVTCAAGEGYTFVADGDDDYITIEGTYGAPETDFSGWTVEVYPIVQGEEIREFKVMQFRGQDVVLGASGKALDTLGQESDQPPVGSFFGSIQPDSENAEAFGWMIPCADLSVLGDMITVTLRVVLDEEGGTGEASGTQEVAIVPVFSGGLFVGWEFSSLNPYVLIQMDCPSMTIEPSTWLTSIGCGITRGITDELPRIFGLLETTMLKTEPLTEAPAVVEIWNAMRRLANVFTIIVLFVIGIMTIFRINPKQFQPGAALGGLLVAVILINLSLLLCEVFIDINNLLVVYIFDIFENTIRSLTEQGLIGGGGTGAFLGVGAMGGYLAAQLTAVAVSALIASGGLPIAGLLAVAAAIATALMGILIAFLILYLVRYAVIWLCVIVAPIIFFLDVLPIETFSGLRKKWFGLFIGFTMIQTLAAMIIGVGMALLLGLSGEGGIAQTVRQLLIAIAVLYLGTKSPSSILSMFGLDVGGAGGLMSGFQGAAKPLEQRVGGLRERFATGKGILGEREAQAKRAAGLAAAGGLGAGALGLATHFGIGKGTADSYLSSRRVDKRATAAERAEKQAVVEEDVAAARDKRKIIKPLADAGNTAYYRGKDYMPLHDRGDEEIIEGLDLGHVQKYEDEKGNYVRYENGEKFALDNLAGDKASDFGTVAESRTKAWVGQAAIKRAGKTGQSQAEAARSIEDGMISRAEAVNPNIAGMSDANKLKEARQMAYRDVRSSVINLGQDISASGADEVAVRKQAITKDRLKRQVEGAGGVIPGQSPAPQEGGIETVKRAARREEPEGGKLS